MTNTQRRNTILVLGATGKTGRRIAERLTNQGLPVRLGSRSATPPFAWEDQNTWQPALQNIESAYVSYYPALAFPGATAIIRSFAKLAVDNGVRRLVLLSGRGEPAARLSEQTIEDSGAEWTIIRASWFNQNFSEGYLFEPVLSGEVAFPGGQVPEPFIDVEDIADVAAAALTDTKHAGQLYEVTGPRLLTFAEAVAEIAEATGRDIRYVPITPKEYEAALLGYGIPADFVTPLIDMFATVLDGRNANLADGVQRALGRQPRDFADFARETAASGVWSGTPAA